jgi:uncharacterized OB-fold protein
MSLITSKLFTIETDATAIWVAQVPRRLNAPQFEVQVCLLNRGKSKAVTLEPQGTLYSVTVQAYRPLALFVMDNWVPYALGLVDLSEGLRVLAMLSGRQPGDWCIGEPVCLTTEVLRRNTKGTPVLTFKFCPAPMALAAH